MNQDAPQLKIDWQHDGMRSSSGWWWFLVLLGVTGSFLGTLYLCAQAEKPHPFVYDSALSSKSHAP